MAGVSLATAGSRDRGGSAQLNDSALVAVPNPFEINLIFIYLQSPRLEVEMICKFSRRRMNQTQANHCLLTAYGAPPPQLGQETRGAPFPLPRVVPTPKSFLVDSPKPHFVFAPVQLGLITGPVKKVQPS